MAKNHSSGNAHIIPSLYRLIRSLSSAQKRDIKKNANFLARDKEQKYIALFDHIVRYIQDQKDVEDLYSSLISSKKFGLSSALNATADYLFNKILDSVRGTAGAIPPRQNKILTALYDIHFLFYKELYAECYKLVREAKRLAHEMDRPIYILELQIWEARLTTRINQVSWRLAEMQEEQDAALENIHATYTTFLQAQRLFVAGKKMAGSDVPADVRDLMESIQNHQNDSLNSLPPRLHYWRLIELQYLFELKALLDQHSEQVDSSQKNLSSALYHLQENMEFMKEKGSIITEEEPIIYEGALENYLSACLKMKNREGMQKVEAAFVNNGDKKDEIHRYRSIIFYKMLSFISFNQFKEACSYVEDEDLESNLKMRQHLINDTRMCAIRYSCIQAYFLNSDFENALKWADFIMNSPKSQSIPLVYQLSDLIRAICLLELNLIANRNGHMDTLIRKYQRKEPKNKFLYEMLVAVRYAAKQRQEPFVKETTKRRRKLDVYLQENAGRKIYGPVLAWLDTKTVKDTTLAIEILKYNA